MQKNIFKLYALNITDITITRNFNSASNCDLTIVTTAKVTLLYQTTILRVFREYCKNTKSRHIDITTAKVTLLYYFKFYIVSRA